MDIPAILQAYGGNIGVLAVSGLLLVSDRKHSAERREELRKDIDREAADNERLRGIVRDQGNRIVELEEQLRRCRRGEE